MMYTINAPVWHFPKFASGKIIIVIDKQKSWESVADFRDRVIDLFRSQKMSEKHDQRFMSRVFLGGLRPQILNPLLKNEHYFIFKSVTFHAEFLEMVLLQNDIMDEGDYVAHLMMGGGPDAAPAQPAIMQDGDMFFGEPNKKIDELYKAQYVLVLYR